MKLEKKLELRAIQLAKLAKSSTGTNPKVGAIIFDDEENIVSEGYHQLYGGPHAEVEAVNNLPDKSTQYTSQLSILISLEPCNHFGKTPPCIDLIKNYQFKKAIIASLDPDTRMSGKSLDILNKTGIKTELLDDLQSSNTLLKTFKVNISKKRPYIYLKIAMDKEGTIGDNNQRLIITDKVSQMFSHKIRSEVNAILIGRKTAELDNPELSTRMAGGKNPLRIIIDLNNSLNGSLKIFNDENKTLYICARNRNDLGNNTFVYQTSLTGENLLLEILQYIYQHKNVGSLLVEGGAETLNSFIKYNLWDELFVFRSNQKATTQSAVEFKIPPAQLQRTISLKSDILSVYTPI